MWACPSLPHPPLPPVLPSQRGNSQGLTEFRVILVRCDLLLFRGLLGCLRCKTSSQLPALQHEMDLSHSHRVSAPVSPTLTLAGNSPGALRTECWAPSALPLSQSSCDIYSDHWILNLVSRVTPCSPKAGPVRMQLPHAPRRLLRPVCGCTAQSRHQGASGSG